MQRFLNLMLAFLLVVAVMFAAAPAHAQYGAFQTQFITVQNIDGSFSQVAVATPVCAAPAFAVGFNTAGYSAFASPFVGFNSFGYSSPFISTGFFRPSVFVGPRFAFGTGFRTGFVTGVGFRAGFVTGNGRFVATNHPAAFRASHPLSARFK